MKFSIKDFFSKCDQICSFLRIWSHLLNKALMENFIFCAVFIVQQIIETFSNVSLLLLHTLREKWPNTEFFLVRIFLYSVRIQGNTDQKKLHIFTLFTQRYRGQFCGFLCVHFAFFIMLNTAWKVPVVKVILAHIFPHSDWIRRDTRKIWTRKTPITDTFHAVLTVLTVKNFCFTEFSTKIHWNGRLAACDVFHMFTQLSSFNSVIGQMSEKLNSSNRQ